MRISDWSSDVCSSDLLESMHRIIPLEDLEVLNSIEFGKVRLTDVDKELATYLRYVASYPRTTVAQLVAGDYAPSSLLTCMISFVMMKRSIWFLKFGDDQGQPGLLAPDDG